MNIPLDGVSLPPSLPDNLGPSKLQTTTLPNGLKIASEMSPVRPSASTSLPNFCNCNSFMFTQNPAASVGLYVDCGSIYETPFSRGATHLLERMAFKSTLNRSHVRLVREIESMGASTSASSSREQMGYTINALKTYVPQMVEVLVDSVRNPAFVDWEVNDEVNLLCFAHGSKNWSSRVRVGDNSVLAETIFLKSNLYDSV